MTTFLEQDDKQQKNTGPGRFVPRHQQQRKPREEASHGFEFWTFGFWFVESKASSLDILNVPRAREHQLISLQISPFSFFANESIHAKSVGDSQQLVQRSRYQ
ncbi:hypothetical protein [Thauera sp.]|uniref:hypothetical protein n=1 Tax=Thauera sp. TaxID=1905334 RepID=UPI002BAFBDB9|nr:hypothetical protein [Thauera sp.]HRP26767.1 hypothetical protein [Thauera sp.]